MEKQIHPDPDPDPDLHTSQKRRSSTRSRQGHVGAKVPSRVSCCFRHRQYGQLEAVYPDPPYHSLVAATRVACGLFRDWRNTSISLSTLFLLS